jgi:hypothetical protein
MRRSRLTLAIVLAVVGLACHGSPQPRPTAGPAADVPLTVVNHNWQDVTILIVHDGVTERIGLAVSASDANFILPWRYFASRSTVYLIADPVGDPSQYNSDNLLVQPGQQIVWTLETDLYRSSIGVY